MIAMNLGNIGKDTRFITFIDTPSAESLEQLSELVERGALRPVVQKTYDLSDVPRALADQQDGGSRGKRVITVRSR